VDQFLNRPAASFAAAGCILLLCGAVAIGGFIFVAGFYASPSALIPTSSLPTRIGPTPTRSLSSENPAAAPSPTTNTGPQGKIAYVCQIFKDQLRDQICIINADGTGQRRLTTNDHARHFYPSMAPDGKTVLYSSDMNGNFKIFEQNLADQSISLGNIIGIAPEVSPNNQYIAYTQGDGKEDTIWIADRDGTNQHLIYKDAWDPTWSPDSASLLFATNIQNKPQLAIINLDGTGFRSVTDLPDLRGRSSWSSDGLHIVTYSGKPWERELFLLNADGSDVHQVSPTGGNSQGPGFSPDGQWIVFTAYFDHYRVNNGCEIYIMRIDGSALTRLTDNDYCDWQPRWGP
jgi:Tol biopolymer transport system component